MANLQRPTSAGEYRRAVSFFTVEHLFHVFLKDSVEVVRDFDFTLHKAPPTDFLSYRRVDGDDLDHGLTRLGDDEGFALGGLLDEFGEMSFGFVNIDGFHWRTSGL